MAILTPKRISSDITEVKKYFAKCYKSHAALKSPPHVTLVSPFQYALENEAGLFRAVDDFCAVNDPFFCKIRGYGAFEPRVIFMDVLPNSELDSMYWAINDYLEKTVNLKNKARKFEQFSPHLTLAFKDLTKENFFLAWEEFKDKEIHYTFEANTISILRHNGKTWDVAHSSLLKRL